MNAQTMTPKEIAITTHRTIESMQWVQVSMASLSRRLKKQSDKKETEKHD